MSEQTPPSPDIIAGLLHNQLIQHLAFWLTLHPHAPDALIAKVLILIEQLTKASYNHFTHNPQE